MDNNILELQNISFKDGNEIILNNISFNVKKGEHLAIVGASGSGKSTLLRIINRLIEPTSGTVTFQNKNYITFAPQKLRQKIGLVLQSPFLFPTTVSQNITFGPLQENKNLSKQGVGNLLKKVGLPSYASRDVNKLSGGEAQRVSLARTLANNPSVLLLDEPTSALDQKSRTVIEDLILDIAKNTDLTFIIVTHNKQQAKKLTNKFIELEKGQIKQIGKF